MIEVKNIYKSYGRGEYKINALNGLSFTVNEGEIFGVIGPDGSGKSSLLKILASLILPDSGIVIMNGYNVVKDYSKIRQIIGYMPGRFSLYHDLSVEENLNFFATLFNTTVKENYHLIKDIYQQIEPFKDRRADMLSGGMKQKLALSCALIHKPKILLLDEPTTGVDPVSRKELWDMLSRLKEQGLIIMVSTAYMDEARKCDRIAFIKDGEFITLDTPQNIIDNYSERLWAVKGDKVLSLLTMLRAHNKVKNCFAFGDKIHITVENDLEMEEIKKHLTSKDVKDVTVTPIEPTVEDCFMALTN